jgi:hypothetical protein
MKVAAPVFIAIAAGSLLVSGCEPCSGVPTCSVAASIPVEGRIVETISGRPVSGVRVTVISAAAPESTTVVTGSDGHWRVVLPPGGDAGATVDVIVDPPSSPAYRVEGIALREFTRRGDGNVLESWVDRPNFPILGEIILRGHSGIPLEGVTARFTQTSGPPLVAGEGSGRFSAVTNEHGHFILLGRGVFAQSAEEISGDLTIEISPTFPTSTHRGLTLRPSYVFREPWRVVRLNAGPSLDYVVEFHDWATLTPVGGVEMEFRRTGGVATDPGVVITRSNEHGHAAIGAMRPLGAGVVIGDMYVRPAPPARAYVVRGLELATFDDDLGRLIAVWGVGPDYPGPPGAEPHP